MADLDSSDDLSPIQQSVEVVADTAVRRVPRENWGLQFCKPERGCILCKVVDGDRDHLRTFRDFYTYGVELQVLARWSEVPSTAINAHAHQVGWNKKRGRDRTKTKLALEVELLAKARLRDSWHIMDARTGDNALNVLSKSAGNVDKIEINNSVSTNITWEDIMERGHGMKQGVEVE